MSSSKPVLDVLTMTGTAPGAVTAHRAVGFNDAQASVAEQAVKGIAVSDATTGQAYPIKVMGTEIAETGAEITAAGIELITDNQGRVVPYVDGGHIFARSLEAAGGAGEFIEILLK